MMSTLLIHYISITSIISIFTQFLFVSGPVTLYYPPSTLPLSTIFPFIYISNRLYQNLCHHVVFNIMHCMVLLLTAFTQYIICFHPNIFNLFLADHSISHSGITTKDSLGTIQNIFRRT